MNSLILIASRCLNANVSPSSSQSPETFNGDNGQDPSRAEGSPALSPEEILSRDEVDPLSRYRGISLMSAGIYVSNFASGRRSTDLLFHEVML